GQAARQIEVIEHVAAPDVVDGIVRQRQRFDASGLQGDPVVYARAGDALPRLLQVQGDRIDADDAAGDAGHQLDGVVGVAAANVEAAVAGAGAEFRKAPVAPVRGAR